MKGRQRSSHDAAHRSLDYPNSHQKSTRYKLVLDMHRLCESRVSKAHQHSNSPKNLVLSLEILNQKRDIRG